MAKLKKRRSFTLVGLLLLMIVLIAAYFTLNGKDKDSEGSENTENTENTQDSSINLLSLEEASIVKLYYKNGVDEVILTLVGEDWVLAGKENVPLNETYTSKMVSTLATLEATKQIGENLSNLSEYGLEEPALTIIATLSDGSTNTIEVGDPSPFSDGYYATLNGSNTVYMVESSLHSTFDYNESELIELEDGPTITASNITYLHLKNREGVALEIEYMENNPYDYSQSNMYPYVLLQPYETPITADSTKVNTLFENYTFFDYLQCIEYNSEDLTPYGLDEPAYEITLNYYEEQEGATEESSSEEEDETKAKTIPVDYNYTLFIGNKNEEDQYYVKDSNSNHVYVMSASTIDKMVQVTPFEYVNSYVQMVNIKTIGGLNIKVGSEEYVLEIKRENVTNEDGEEETIETFYVNGKEMEDAEFRGLYQAIISTKYDAEIPEGEHKNREPVATFTFLRSEYGYEDITVTYYPYDDSFYSINSKNIDYFLTDLRSINEVIEKIRGASITE